MKKKGLTLKDLLADLEKERVKYNREKYNFYTDKKVNKHVFSMNSRIP